MSLMRDPGTEPLVMIGGDVVELTKMLYAEREAHAAEVARLRAALDVTTGACQLVANWYRTKTVNDALVLGKAALAAPPSAAVEAVEAMRKALEAWNNYAQYLGPAAIPQYQQSCDALAAYEEAIRG